MKPANHGHIKAIMLQKREKRGGAVKCDLCGEFTSEPHKHELVNSARVSTPFGRRLAEDEALSSILCPACHSQAHNPEVRRELLIFNIYMLSSQEGLVKAYTIVEGLLQNLERVEGYPLGIDLPSLKWMAMRL